MRPLRHPALLLAALAPCSVAGTAAAQILDGGTTATTFASGDFFIGVQHEMGANLSDFDVARFFNKAHCDCDETVYVYVALTDSGFAKRAVVDRTGNIEFWVGSDCGNNDGLRTQRCSLLSAQTLAAFLNDGRVTIATSARVLSTNTTVGGVVDGGTIGSFTPNPTCTTPGLESFNQTIFVITYSSQGSPQVLASRQILIDLTAPPDQNPDDIQLQPGNEALVISWPGVDSAIITDLLGYQVLCNRAGALQVFADNTFGAEFQTCSNNLPDGAGVAELNPKFICSPLLSPTTRSYRVKILQNGINYGVAVVAIDRSGNASAPFILYDKPIKTKSFYDVYRNDDPDHPGTATGGLCALGAGGSSRGALGGLGAALAIAALAIARRRRRR